MRGKLRGTLIAASAITSFVLQTGTFMGLYWLRLERHIGRPGSYPHLAFFLDRGWPLWTTGTALSLVVCTALHLIPSSDQEEPLLGTRWLDAGVEALRVTLLVALLALPSAVFLALNWWGS